MEKKSLSFMLLIVIAIALLFLISQLNGYAPENLFPKGENSFLGYTYPLVLPNLVGTLLAVACAMLFFYFGPLSRNLLDKENNNSDIVDELKSLNTIVNVMSNQVYKIPESLVSEFCDTAKNITDKLNEFNKDSSDENLSNHFCNIHYRDEVQRVEKLIEQTKAEELRTHKILMQALFDARRNSKSSFHVLTATPQSVLNYYTSELLKEWVQGESELNSRKIQRILIIEEVIDSDYHSGLRELIKELNESSDLRVISKSDMDHAHPGFFKDYGVFSKKETTDTKEAIFAYIKTNGGDTIFAKSPGTHYRTGDQEYIDSLEERFKEIWNGIMKNKTAEQWLDTHNI